MTHFKVWLAILGVACGWVVAGVWAKGPPAADAKPRLSKAYTHDNLTVYLISAAETTVGRKVIPLAEALAEKTAVVQETSDVNRLLVENKGEVAVFVMTGDIVKGGKQDRVLAIDMILPPKSGPVSIPCFCVEQGRWQRRGAEDAARFSGSSNVAVGKSLKGAISSGRNQQEVWKEVAENQSKLSSNVGKSVQSAQSASSFQLSLEDKDVQAQSAAYEKALADAAKNEKESLGLVVVVNGQISSADTFGSRELFLKLWPRLLQSAALEALAERKKEQKFTELSADAVDKFLSAAVAGKKEEDKYVAAPVGRAIQQRANNAAQNLIETGNSQNSLGAPDKPDAPTADAAMRNYRYDRAESLVTECQDKTAADQVIHRSYLSKKKN